LRSFLRKICFFFVYFMNRSFRFLYLPALLFVLAVVFSLSAIAQTAAPTPKPTPRPAPTPPPDEVVKIFEVRLPIAVKNKKNENVAGLTRDDFIVLEDKIPQEITFFSDEKNNPPVYVGVLMDTSPSTAGKMKFSKEAAQNFIQTVVRLRKDKAAFMTFDNEIKLLQDFTDKQDLLFKAVDKVGKTGSQTALYDAIWQFCNEKLRTAPGRRVLVVITDGDDTFSRADINDAIDLAQRTETTIFAISTKSGFLGTVPGVDTGQVNDKGDKDLVRMCQETGGEAFFTGDMIALEKSFTKISNELRSQYILTYRPKNQEYDGTERLIEVRFADKQKQNDYKIRTKKKYRAVKDTLK
jgi:Ca-activated chloride channel family protein